jgi:hypothetical protein
VANLNMLILTPLRTLYQGAKITMQSSVFINRLC